MARHDVATYSPNARLFYDAASALTGGGAERRTWLLARSLARRGARVAHIVHPVADPAVDPAAPVTLVQRKRVAGRGLARALAGETAEIWRALNRADARVQVFAAPTAQWASPGHGCAGTAATSSSPEPTTPTSAGELHRPPGSARGPLLRRHGRDERRRGAVRRSGAPARERFPSLGRVEEVPSFVEPAPIAESGEAFLWVSRLAEYKRPLLYADLAAAVPEARFWMIVTKTEDPAYDATIAELRRREQELPNLELLPQRRHADLQALIGRAVAMINTSSYEGMPNTWLEGWARGVPALTMSFDPDGRIARRGLGVSAGGSWEAFAAGARDLWARRTDRDSAGPALRQYVTDVHGRRVADSWAALLLS